MRRGDRPGPRGTTHDWSLHDRASDPGSLARYPAYRRSLLLDPLDAQNVRGRVDRQPVRPFSPGETDRDAQHGFDGGRRVSLLLDRLRGSSFDEPGCAELNAPTRPGEDLC